MQMKSERGNIRSSILAGDRKKNRIDRVAPIGQQVGLAFAWEPDVDNSVAAVWPCTPSHCVLLPASQSVSPNTLIANSATS